MDVGRSCVYLLQFLVRQVGTHFPHLATPVCVTCTEVLYKIPFVLFVISYIILLHAARRPWLRLCCCGADSCASNRCRRRRNHIKRQVQRHSNILVKSKSAHEDIDIEYSGEGGKRAERAEKTRCVTALIRLFFLYKDDCSFAVFQL